MNFTAKITNCLLRHALTNEKDVCRCGAKCAGDRRCAACGRFNTLAKDVIVAQRLGVNISFGEYVPPVEVPEAVEEAPAEEIAA